MKKSKNQKSKKHFFLLPIIFVLLGILLWFIVKLFFSSSWDGKSRFTIIFSTKPVIVVSYNPTDESLAAVSVPWETYVEATHGYGRYRLGKVYEVGNLDGNGPEVLKSTVRELLGVPIEGYIDMKSVNFGDTENLTASEFIAKRKIILGWSNFFRIQGKTDLSVSDLWQFYTHVFGVKAGKISFVNLKTANVLVEQTLPDQTQILAADTLRLDGLLRDLFHEDALALENLKLAVLNSTDVSGLGEKMARILGNMGLQVVKVTNFKNVSDNCLLYIDKKSINLLTVIKLKHVFNCEVKTTVLSDVRADIALVVGTNYARELTAK